MFYEDYIMFENYEDEQIIIYAHEDFKSLYMKDFISNNPICYIEDVTKSFTFYFDYVVGKYKDSQKVFGSFVGEDTSNSDTEVLGDCRIYRLYAFDCDNEANALKLFDCLINLARTRECKFVKLKLSGNHSNFYDFCKQKLNMQQNQDWLYLAI